MSKGNLFIVTGPSGAGKGTVLGRLLPTMEQLQYSVSATTRAPREGEEDGVNYYFLNRNDFLNMVDRGEFLEYAEYVGNFYGTPAGPVDECLEKGVDVILEIEVQGALTVKSKRPEAKLVFIIPPTFADLELRLRSRGSESDEVIAKRLEKAKNIPWRTTMIISCAMGKWSRQWKSCALSSKRPGAPWIAESIC